LPSGPCVADGTTTPGPQVCVQVGGGDNGGEVCSATAIDSCGAQQVIQPVAATGGEGGNGSGGNGDCLRSDSQVTLADGSSKPASAIALGDKLLGPDGTVIVTGVNQSPQQQNFYQINGLKLAVSGDHPVKTTEGWKAADDTNAHAGVTVGRLEVGDVLVTQKGLVKVKKIKVLQPGDGYSSINISTAGDKPYYVDGVTIKPFKSITLAY